MRIGLIGNSHIAALKLGWKQAAASYPDVDVTFWGATKGKIDKIRPVDGRLVPLNETIREALSAFSGQDTVPGNLDAYFVVGQRFSFEFLHHSFRTHRPLKFRETDKQALISESFARQSILEALAASPAMMLVQKLRKITTAPIALLPCPFLSSEAEADFAYSKLWTNEPLRDWSFGLYQEGVAAARKLLPVLEQPAETIERKLFTRPEFCRGAVRLEGDLTDELKARDFRHMNADFGALYMRDVIRHASSVLAAHSLSAMA